jgi:hypothetical protein
LDSRRTGPLSNTQRGALLPLRQGNQDANLRLERACDDQPQFSDWSGNFAAPATIMANASEPSANL